MKETPIMMSAELIPKILDGSKTQSRRVIKPQPIMTGQFADYKNITTLIENLFEYCPYGQVGDRLWVRETWVPTFQGLDCLYKADEIGKSPSLFPVSGWKSSIHMPRWASRITLEITEVRVERVQEITEQDCLAEGIEPFKHSFIRLDKLLVQKYQDLWDSLNAKRGYGWEVNPWVWVLSFKVAG